MVKRFLIETRNLCIPAFVVGMTDIAGLWFERAMKTRFVLHVSPNVLVTRGAQSRLPIAIEFDVTLLAVVLQFGVPPNHIARRQDRLDTLRQHHMRQNEQPQPCRKQQY